MKSAVIALFCLVTVAPVGVGCKGDKKGDTSILADLPENTETVGGIRFDSLAGFLEKLGYEKEARAGLMSKSVLLTKIDSRCKLDPMSTIKSFTFGYGPDLKDAAQRYFVLELDVSRTDAHSCIEKLSGEGVDIAVAEKGEFFEYRASGETYYGWWPSDKRVVWVEAPSPAPLSGLVNEGKNATGNKELAGLLEKTKTNALFWTAGRVPKDPKFIERLSSFGPVPDAGYAWVHLPADGPMTAKVSLTWADEADAKKMYKRVGAALDMLKKQSSALEDLDLDLSGSAITASATLNRAAFNALGDLAKAM